MKMLGLSVAEIYGGAGGMKERVGSESRTDKNRGLPLVVWCALLGGVFLVGLIKTWPIPLDPRLLDSLKLYSKYVVGGQTRVSDLLGAVDIACAVGPYDSYLDARFSKMLIDKQIVAAEDALNKQNKTSHGDNRFFLVGLRGEKVESIYLSNFFSNLPTMNKKSTAALNCVGGDGFISPEKFRETIVIKLNKGA